MQPEREPRRLELEVQLGREPIQGRLYDHETGGQDGWPFSGWLGLFAAIDAARCGSPAPQREERS